MRKIIVFAILGITVSLNAQVSFEINKNKSIVNWSGSKVFNFDEHNGTVAFRGGNVVLSGNRLVGGDFVVDMNTIMNTDGAYNEMLVDHLKGTDFFDVPTYPDAKLKIVKAIDKGNNTYEVYADLTIKHITNRVKFNTKISFLKSVSKMTAKFIIDRTLWNIVYKTKGISSTFKDGVISDAIELEVYLEWLFTDKC